MPYRVSFEQRDHSSHSQWEESFAMLEDARFAAEDAVNSQHATTAILEDDATREEYTADEGWTICGETFAGD